MSVRILPGPITSLAPGGRHLFLAAVDGVEPYRWTLDTTPPNAGGSIDFTTGIYTSPLVQNQDSFGNYVPFDTAIVTDANNDTSSLRLLVGHPIILLCDIIQREMSLSPGDVILWDQKFQLPKSPSVLFITVQELSCKAFSNSLTIGSDDQTVQSTNFQSTISIDIWSRGQQAVRRKEEIVMALGGIYSQQMQELNGFYVSKLPSAFVNLSQEDGAAIPYRYNINVGIQYFIKTTMSVDRYTSFSVAVEQVEP